ncbi:4'-phosphopantetheinyl transferase superfamily protein [Streptomyces sp. NBC_01275]|uniref:4'-phosphopantetheinyl transferase family protein n=1 Tax=Streptomyces sp. NBC_01275 TaxID=2903807 RepID=UPI00224FC45A|nr:4'-phosphopantetheinyl transferase superfamily protein [Streptomyces sp. NBC_01275]MCX4759597.1 4'-phosphopantetheinyl transferase superfamily protein [Streptomyces sp. NBC_01275]
MAGTADRHLWLLPERAAEGFVARLGGTALLTDGERARCERPLALPARLRRTAALLLARHALSSLSGHPLDSWRFTATSDGRPEPVTPLGSGLRFNLSHTDGLIACVVTEGGRACGVDTEAAHATADAVRHLPAHFAEPEQADLARLADLAAVVGERARAARVAAYWVLKEAYLKALGTGLRRELSSIAFAGLPGPFITLDDTRRSARFWQFDLVHPTPDHVVAVATEHTGPQGLRTTVVTD